MAKTVINVILFVVISALTLLLGMQILPIFLDVIKTAVLFSPDIATRDIAGLITISGAATHKISILYGTEDANYNIEVKGRLVTVERLDDQGKVAERSPPSKTAIDPNVLLTNVNKIVIENIFGRYDVRGQ